MHDHPFSIMLCYTSSLGPSVHPVPKNGSREAKLENQPWRMWQFIGEVTVALASWPEGVQGRRTEGFTMCSLQPHNSPEALGPHASRNCSLRKRIYGWKKSVWPNMVPLWTQPNGKSLLKPFYISFLCSYNFSKFCNFNLSIRNAEVFVILL